MALKRILQFSFVVLLAGLIYSSCKKDPKPAPDLGYNYFPGQIGHYVIYEVDSTVYDDFTHDTIYFRYQIKELTQSKFTDNEGREALRIERWIRHYNDTIPYDNIPWTLSRVWSAVLTTMQAERVEENVRYIKLVFPPEKNKDWNGNAQNTIGEWEYEYEEVDKPVTVNSLHFDSALLVSQITDINQLNHRFYQERYARNVGLIEKTVIDVADTALCCGPVLSRIHRGVKVNYKIVSWGQQ